MNGQARSDSTGTAVSAVSSGMVVSLFADPLTWSIGSCFHCHGVGLRQ